MPRELREIHFVCRDRKNVLDETDTHFETGYWKVKHSHLFVDDLIIALHQSRTTPSYLHGSVETFQIRKIDNRVTFRCRKTDQSMEWASPGAQERYYVWEEVPFPQLPLEIANDESVFTKKSLREIGNPQDFSYPFWSDFNRLSVPVDTPRQRDFEKFLITASASLNGNALPYAFRDNRGRYFRLDKGCVGHAIANEVLKPPKEFELKWGCARVILLSDNVVDGTSKRLRLPDSLERSDILSAINEFATGVEHGFAPSIGYDLLHDGKRYPPKAIIGLAATRVTGEVYRPKDFKGGIGSKCFNILEGNGFTIVRKHNVNVYPEQVTESDYYEGAVTSVKVNRYERNAEARARCIDYYGTVCTICNFDFELMYGALGDGFIHVHHVIPISQIGSTYKIDPIEDLRPVCPNCHAMLHRKEPPLAIEELKQFIRANA